MRETRNSSSSCGNNNRRLGQQVGRFQTLLHGDRGSPGPPPCPPHPPNHNHLSRDPRDKPQAVCKLCGRRRLELKSRFWSMPRSPPLPSPEGGVVRCTLPPSQSGDSALCNAITAATCGIGPCRYDRATQEKCNKLLPGTVRSLTRCACFFFFSCVFWCHVISRPRSRTFPLFACSYPPPRFITYPRTTFARRRSTVPPVSTWRKAGLDGNRGPDASGDSISVRWAVPASNSHRTASIRSR